MSIETKKKLKGAATIGAMVSLGIFLVGGLVAAVTEMVQTRNIAEQANAISQDNQAKIGPIESKLANVTSNTYIICKAFKLNCIPPDINK